MNMLVPCFRRVSIVAFLVTALLTWHLSTGFAGDEPEEKEVPRIGLKFHDKPLAGSSLGVTMRFGLYTLKDGKLLKKLTSDPQGLTNNTCLKIDGNPRLFGTTPGKWKARSVQLGKTPEGKARYGLQSIWNYSDEKILVTQTVEVVRGSTGLLDTALIQYEIHNTDTEAHTVGIRFMLDTQIGLNDGPPFLVPGKDKLITTAMDLKTKDKVPSSLKALEKPNVDAPGTVAYVSLKLKGLEAPSRVTVGAWPDGRLKHPAAQGPVTL